MKNAIFYILAVVAFFAIIMGMVFWMVCQLPLPFDRANFDTATYRVCGGDTLWSIAKENTKKTGTDIDSYITAVCNYNGIKDRTHIERGEVITIFVEK